MSFSDKFVPRAYEVDYDLDPCYDHYGLRDGDINLYSLSSFSLKNFAQQSK